MIRCWLLLVSAFAFVVVFGAAGSPRARADANTEARVFFEQGNRLLQESGRQRGARRQRLLEEALAAFLESLRIVRSRNAIFNAGHALEQLDRLDEAFGYFAEYLTVPGLTAEERTEGTGRIDALRSRVAVLAIESDPPGADVRIDRAELASRGVTPLEVAVPAGTHRFFLSLVGYENAETQAEAETGERLVVRGALRQLPVSLRIRVPSVGQISIDGEPIRPDVEFRVPPGRHTIRFVGEHGEPIDHTIEISPGSEPVTIDLGAVLGRYAGRIAIRANVAVEVSSRGRRLGLGASLDVRLEEGPHVLELRADGFAPERVPIEVRRDQPIVIESHMEPLVDGERELGAVPWVVAGGAAVTGAIAVGLSVRALGIEDDAYNRRDNTTRSDADSANFLADLFWIGTAALATTAVILAVLNDEVEQPSSTTTVALAPILDGAMLMASVPWSTP